jgi:hypothetical protein
MLYFPQLHSGATVQYPFVKRRIYRTITSAAPDGGILKLGDPAWTMAEWELRFKTLSSQERTELEAFFNTVEGRLGEFTFLDPTDNLLVRSGDLAAAAWTKGPLVQFTTGQADPEGGSEATRVSNTGAGPQSIQQTVEGPGWFHYCFSFYASSEQPLSLAVFRFTGGVEDVRSCPVNSNWQRLALSGRSQGAEESITFGIRLEAGTAVNVYGMQVEAQPAPSAYRKTTSRGGVRANARFNDDVLELTSEGPEQHSSTVRILASLAS